MSDQNKDNKMIYLGVPQDKDIQAAFGVLMIRSGQLEYALRMVIKSLANISIEEALGTKRRETSGALKDRIKKLAKQRLGEGSPLLRLQAILNRADRAAKKRNKYVHSLRAQELDGPAVIRNEDHSWGPVPAARELEQLANEVHAIIKELNLARLDGFLSEVLANVG